MEVTDFTEPTANEPFILRPGDDNWGPFGFNCSPHLPDGTSITAAEAMAYSDYSEEEAAGLVESDSILIVDDTSIQLSFDASADISAGDYYVRVALTLSSGGIKYLLFGPITVERW